MGLNIDLDKLMKEYRESSRYEEGKILAEKWDATGLLSGIDGEFERSGMATLLENQARQLMLEVSRTSTTGNTEGWSDVALPLVRRVFAKIVSQELLSVQPMSMPSGLVFWLDFTYGNTKPTGDGFYASGESVYGNVSSSNISGTAMGDLYAFDYSYTKNYVSSSDVGTSSYASASWQDFNYNSDLSASIAANPLDYKKIGVLRSGLSGGDFEAVKAFTIVDSTNVATLYRQYTTTTDTEVLFIVSGAEPAQVTGSPRVASIEYIAASTANDRGDFEQGQSGVGPIPEINISMRNEPVVANTRKLKAVWTPEIAQDLNAYHAIDAESELTGLLSEYISMEIDMELVDMLWTNALITDYWSAKMGSFVNSVDGSLIANGPTFYGTEMEWYQTLIRKITKVSNEIHKRTLRGGANWLVVGTTIATILESFKPGFVDDTADIESTEYAMGIQRIGTLNNRWKVYKNPYFREDAILIGFKGGSFLESGAAYLPYVPLIMTPLVYDPDNFVPRKGVMTRYAKKMIRPEFYGKIIIRDLNLI